MPSTTHPRRVTLDDVTGTNNTRRSNRAATRLSMVTRGTTHPNRLRRVDRWLVGPGASVLCGATDPLVIDLGFGASATTTVELWQRLRVIRPDVTVIGLDVDPTRVQVALSARRPGVDFAIGGFEIPIAGRRPAIVRALNVLRQYDVDAVPAAWSAMQERLAPGGIVIDGTCDEVGRLASWVVLAVHGPVSLTFSLRLAGLIRPSHVAARLPKVLSQLNVPGEPVHHWLNALDGAWARHAGLAALGARQRFIATVRSVRDEGWPVQDGPTRWRLGEVTIPWSVIAPRLS
ncbi:MAG: class I SAM-dependent methyltransferase [Actinomycetota bacterium]